MWLIIPYLPFMCNAIIYISFGELLPIIIIGGSGRGTETV